MILFYMHSTGNKEKYETKKQRYTNKDFLSFQEVYAHLYFTRCRCNTYQSLAELLIRSIGSWAGFRKRNP